MTITITKRGYWCLRVVYTSCQGLESDGRNFLAAIVPAFSKKGWQISLEECGADTASVKFTGIGRLRRYYLSCFKSMVRLRRGDPSGC
jgi:hypothetical protein